MSLSAAALRRPVTTIAATLIVVLLGAVSLGRLPVSLLPDVTLPVLTIRTLYPGAAPAEVSRFVAEPVEQAVAATPGIVDIRSVSRAGEGTTTLRFAWGTDMDGTVLDVRERLDNARSLLPEAAHRPTLLTSNPGERPITVLALSTEGNLQDMARLARDVHARRLEQLGGVASVAVVGAPEEEVRIDLDPDRLRVLGLTPDDVARAVKDANVTAVGGTVRKGQFRFSMRALTELARIEEILDVPLPGRHASLRMRDIATVELGTRDPLTVSRLDGRAAIALVVYKDAGANTVGVTRDIRRTLAQLQREFPSTHVEVVSEQARFVTDALANLAQEIVLGGLLSLAVILLFLRDWRTSLAIGAMIPLSVLVSLVALQLLGVTINILSLGGLALGVGLLVDNAIVVAEATGRHRAAGKPRMAAAQAAAEELAGPLTAGTLTTVLVFVPIIFVQGLAGALFRDLSLSVAVSLTSSLLLALTLLPVMMAGRTGAAAPPAVRQRAFPRLDDLGQRLAHRYETGMAWSLAHPGPVLAIAAATVLAAAWILAWLPREILPRVDEGALVATLQLPEGTAIEETSRQVARLEAAAQARGSRNTYARVGRATDEEVLAGSAPGGPNQATAILAVPARSSAAEFSAHLRRDLPHLAQGALTLDAAGQGEFGALIGREGRTIRVEVAAPSATATASLADTVRRLMAGIPGLADVREAYQGLQPLVEIEVQRDRLARHDIPLDAVAGALSGALGGLAAGDLRRPDHRVPIRVRYAGLAAEDLGTALATRVNGVPLAQLVLVREVMAPAEVVRSNQRPAVLVEAAVETGGTRRASTAITRRLSALAMPAGGTWQLAGADLEQRRISRELATVALLSIGLVYLVLAAEFASFTTPLLVMLTVPLAGAGGLFLLGMTGQGLNAVSLIGLVVMIGIADNDAVVKIDAIQRFRVQGLPLREAILRGGALRLRAIAMTSLTTIAGVLPLALGLGQGGELYRPLALAVIGGSVTALLVTFFLLPAAYWMVERPREPRA